MKTLRNRRVRARGLHDLAGKPGTCRPGALTGRVGNLWACPIFWRVDWAHLSFWQGRGTVLAVPAGRPRIAQHLSAGSASGPMPSPVRDERNRAPSPPLSSLTGLSGSPVANPALKCWAIFGRPCGTLGARASPPLTAYGGRKWWARPGVSVPHAVPISARRAKRAPSWFGRAERAGGPSPDCIGNRQGTSPARRSGSFSEVLVL